MSDGDVRIKVSAETAEAEAALRRVSAEKDKAARGTAGAGAPGKMFSPEESKQIARSIMAEGEEKATAGRHEREIARTTTERARAEQAITREIREQSAERKAGVLTPGQKLANAVAVGQEVVTGNVSGAASVGGMGGPWGMAAAVAAAVGAVVIKTVAQERDRDTAQTLGIQREGFMRSYRSGRAAGIFGSSGELVGSALGATDEIAERQAARGEINERARVKWYDPSSWTWGGLRKNEGMRERERNEAAIEQAERQREKDIAAAKEKYIKEEGGLELRALRGRSARTLEGNREAFKAEMGAEWLGKYKAVLKESGNEGMATEMANLTVGNKVRDLQASAGAGLVDARTGGAGVAAAAQWATQAFPDVAAEIRNLHATVQSQANPLKNQAK